jgi:hypothetical protein
MLHWSSVYLIVHIFYHRAKDLTNQGKEPMKSEKRSGPGIKDESDSICTKTGLVRGIQGTESLWLDSQLSVLDVPSRVRSPGGNRGTAQGQSN